MQLDLERAPLIEWAFKAYASGNWTVSQLHDELTSRGLVSLPTPKRPSKPLAVSSVHRLLTNPYYKGDVTYRGVVPRQVAGRISSISKVGMVGSARPRCTSIGRFQAIAS